MIYEKSFNRASSGRIQIAIRRGSERITASYGGTVWAKLSNIGKQAWERDFHMVDTNALDYEGGLQGLITVCWCECWTQKDGQCHS